MLIQQQKTKTRSKKNINKINKKSIAIQAPFQNVCTDITSNFEAFQQDHYS